MTTEIHTDSDKSILKAFWPMLREYNETAAGSSNYEESVSFSAMTPVRSLADSTGRRIGGGCLWRTSSFGRTCEGTASGVGC